MAYQSDSSACSDALTLLIENGFEGLAESVELLFNAAMVIERGEYLKASPYERNAERSTHANGFKSKTIRSRLGKLHLSVPQTRDCQFYPNALEKGLRSERALKAALAEMYIQGVSTRKVAKITEQLCGFEVTSTQVSKVTQELDETLKIWRERPLGHYDYLILDARYEKVRHGGQVRDLACLVGIGIDSAGRRQVVGASVSLSEAEVHWRTFLQDLQALR
jgi:transposase-like protein